MKRLLSIITVLVLTMSIIFSGCGSKSKEASKDTQKNTVKVGLLTGVAGLGDKSFNDLAYDGAKKAEKDLKVKLKVVEPPDLASTEGLLRDLANAGNDIVIGVGFDMAEPMKKVSAEFPNTKFAIVDAVVDAKNVQSLVFKEHEGSFLIGALSGLMTKTNKVGTIPAMDIPFLNRFTKAYEQGVKYVNPNATVTVQPIGSDFNAFNDPGKAKNIALSMYSKGIDIIYPVAGGSGTGLFEAAKETKKYALGINSDQDYMAEGLILSSMIKRVDLAVFNSIKDVEENKFEGGVKEFGLSNDGVGLSEMKYTKDLVGSEILNKLDQIKKDIIDGKIKVIDAAK